MTLASMLRMASLALDAAALASADTEPLPLVPSAAAAASVPLSAGLLFRKASGALCVARESLGWGDQ